MPLKPMLENGAGSFDIEMPKNEWCGVSAVRDLPPGCGQKSPTAYAGGNCAEVGNKKAGEIVEKQMLKLACDRKIEKGATEGSRDHKRRTANRSDKGEKKRKTIYHENDTHSPAENMVFSCHEESRVSVQGLMAAGQESGRATSSCVEAKDSREEILTIVPDELLRGDEKSSSEEDTLQKHLSLVTQSREVDVGASCSIDGGARNKVWEMLRLFRAIMKKLLQEEETTPSKLGPGFGRIDRRALAIFKEKGKYTKIEKSILGRVLGVEVGDKFHCRFELMIVGLHRPPQGGIDCLREGGTAVATSIVESGGYDNNVDNSDVWIYTGQGGNAEDQKLDRGNLALKNSIDNKNPVRVIRGVKHTNLATASGGKPKISTTYTYYGLYTVERYWKETAKSGKKEFKFELKRVPGQPALAWKEVKKSKKKEVKKSKNFRKGCCKADISEGKEKLPVCVVNTVDCEKPPQFEYITRMTYPDWCNPLPPQGCGCKNGCSDSNRCACAIKNGGENPYNFDGEIVDIRPLVYECGPNCKCPPDCYNRVSQRGGRFQLEIFKTETRGWGVRSLCSIPSGSFICEYTGKLLGDKDADHTGNDEYLFDIGQNYNDHALWEGLQGRIPEAASNSNEVVENMEFTIDALQCGNVSRFINHSCSPNLCTQHVLYDHEDTRVPHVMLFACENIPPLQELTYHYNYKIGGVCDEDGNVKVKECYCGASDCTHRLY